MTATIEELDLDFIWDMNIPCELKTRDCNNSAEYRLVKATCPSCWTELPHPIMTCAPCKDHAMTEMIVCFICGFVGLAKDYGLVFEKL